MDKIDFVNAQQPAINDTNLNLMQDNIEREINAQVSGDTLPIGALLPFSGNSIPTNWLLCDGREISRTDYAQLFNVIGTRYGVGDGSTTFNIPNMKGRIPVGLDASQTEFDTLGETGGEKTHTLTISEIPSHDHTISHVAVGSNAPGYNAWEENIAAGTGATYKASAKTNATGSGQPHNILQPYLVQRYIIKAFQSAGTVAEIVDVYNNSSSNGYSARYVNNLGLYTVGPLGIPRVGTWIDGKPIYRKVINIGNLPNSTYKDVAHGISNLDIPVKMYGYFYTPSNGTYKPIPYASQTSSSIVTCYVFGNYVRVITNEDDTQSTGHIVLEYTRTTD